VDSDLDLDTPAIVWPDSRTSALAGDGPALELRVRVDAPAAPVAFAGDDQVYAAAELVRRGMATRVVLVNVTLDARLPADWEIRGTPVHLERLGDGRTVLTAGPAAHR
jgi:hypothetical protein